MLDKIFLSILNMSFTGSVVIIFILITRLLLKKSPKVISYALWSVALFRLLCPFSIESVLSLLPTKASPIPTDLAYELLPKIDTGIPIINDTINKGLPAPSMFNSVNPLQVYQFIGSVLWIIGIVVFIVYSVISLIRVKQSLADSVHYQDNIYLSNKIDTPFVMGIIKPKIFLPTSLSDKEKDFIILHERTHISRLDHIVKLISFFTLCLHWFNPFAWILFFLLGKDMEMSCDEAVIKKLGDDVKADYSASLLSLATGIRILNGSPLAFGEGDTKKRIKNVLNYKKPAFWIVAVSVTVLIVLCIGLCLNPKADRASMQWAKNLKPSDVFKIELVVMPISENEQYKLFNDAELNDVVSLINDSRGIYTDNPKALEGAVYNLYITLKDGTRHIVSNSGNYYLNIDGDSYKAGYDWLSSWEYTKGDSATPDGFLSALSNVLTIEKLKEIAKKGDDISFDDFASYDGKDVGHGIYRIAYDVHGGYTLFIGSMKPDSDIEYVRLEKGEDYIDIRYSDIDQFVKDTKLTFWIKPDESAEVVGLNAAKCWLESLKSESTSESDRISDYKINNTVVMPITPEKGKLIETIDSDYIVQVEYDITTVSDKFISTTDGISGKGTFKDLYRELYINIVPNDGGDIYEIAYISSGKESNIFTSQPELSKQIDEANRKNEQLNSQIQDLSDKIKNDTTSISDSELAERQKQIDDLSEQKKQQEQQIDKQESHINSIIEDSFHKNRNDST